MKKFLLAGFTMLTFCLSAQTTKYVDDIYTRNSVVTTNNIFYADGYSVLRGAPLYIDSLRMDMYSSTSNVDPTKPLIIYLHTGSFLPRYINQLATGSRNDSAAVEMCKRYAQKGYVVAAISYRLGWNPAATSETDRKSSIINAAYKGVQDLSAAVRFFKRSVVNGNPYGLDSTKFAVVGQGTGGYITSAYATLDRQSEIKIDKFIDFVGRKAMVNDSVFGNRFGLPIYAGSIYARNNWPNHTSNSRVAVNIGGAMGDTSWLEAGNMPIICVHGIYDPFAPYKTGIVKVPGTNNNVVEVSGGFDIMKKANALGTISAYKGKVYDRYTWRANQLNAGNEGLFPIDGLLNGSGAWEWWDSARIRLVLTASGQFTQASITTINRNSSLSNPAMSKARALLYIDSLQGYTAPRIAVSLGLVASVGIKEVNPFTHIQVYPNPATNKLNVINNTKQNTIQSLEILDLSGKTVYTNTTSAVEQQIPLTYTAGIYVLRITTSKGTGTQKFVIK